MNPIWLAIAVGALAFVGLLALSSVLAGGSAFRRRMQTLRREAAGAGVVDGGWSGHLESARSALRDVGAALPRSPSELSRMERRLMQAGFRKAESVYVFHGIQVVTAVVLLLAFLATARMQTNPVLFAVLAVFLGAAVPDGVLAHFISKRKLQIQLGLPDALDLMVVAVEAGLGLDQALMRISQELSEAHPALSEELRQYSLEVNAGRSRVEALRNLSTRPDVPDLRALTAVLIQTDRFGTSIADSLRVFSDSLRTKRRQRAEEAAAKLPVKMVIPLFLFIFPATLVVVIGPAIIAIGGTLMPMLAGQR